MGLTDEEDLFDQGIPEYGSPSSSRSPLDERSISYTQSQNRQFVEYQAADQAYKTSGENFNKAQTGYQAYADQTERFAKKYGSELYASAYGRDPQSSLTSDQMYKELRDYYGKPTEDQLSDETFFKEKQKYDNYSSQYLKRQAHRDSLGALRDEKQREYADISVATSSVNPMFKNAYDQWKKTTGGYNRATGKPSKLMDPERANEILDFLDFDDPDPSFKGIELLNMGRLKDVDPRLKLSGSGSKEFNEAQAKRRKAVLEGDFSSLLGEHRLAQAQKAAGFTVPATYSNKIGGISRFTGGPEHRESLLLEKADKAGISTYTDEKGQTVNIRDRINELGFTDEDNAALDLFDKIGSAKAEASNAEITLWQNKRNMTPEEFEEGLQEVQLLRSARDELAAKAASMGYAKELVSRAESYEDMSMMRQWVTSGWLGSDMAEFSDDLLSTTLGVGEMTAAQWREISTIAAKQQELGDIMTKQGNSALGRIANLDEGEKNTFFAAIGEWMGMDGLTAIAETIVTSISGLLPAYLDSAPKVVGSSAGAGGLTGFGVAGPAGVIPGLVTGTKIGLRANYAVAEASLEFAATVIGEMREEGVDVTNPNALMHAFADPELRDKVVRKAGKRAGVIGLAGMVSAGMAGRVNAFFKEPVQVVKSIPKTLNPKNLKLKGLTEAGQKRYNALRKLKPQKETAEYDELINLESKIKKRGGFDSPFSKAVERADAQVNRTSWKARFRNAAAEAGFGASMGAGGEAVAQLVTREPGDPMDYHSIIAEFVGESPAFVFAPLEAKKTPNLSLTRAVYSNERATDPIQPGDRLGYQGKVQDANRQGWKYEAFTPDTVQDAVAYIAKNANLEIETTSADGKTQLNPKLQFLNEFIGNIMDNVNAKGDVLKFVISDRTPENTDNLGYYDIDRTGAHVVYLNNQAKSGDDIIAGLLHELPHVMGKGIYGDEKVMQWYNQIDDKDKLQAFGHYMFRDTKPHADYTAKGVLTPEERAQLDDGFKNTPEETKAQEWFTFEFARVLAGSIYDKDANYKKVDTGQGSTKHLSSLPQGVNAEILSFIDNNIFKPYSKFIGSGIKRGNQRAMPQDIKARAAGESDVAKDKDSTERINLVSEASQRPQKLGPEEMYAQILFDMQWMVEPDGRVRYGGAAKRRNNTVFDQDQIMDRRNKVLTNQDFVNVLSKVGGIPPERVKVSEKYPEDGSSRVQVVDDPDSLIPNEDIQKALAQGVDELDQEKFQESPSFERLPEEKRQNLFRQAVRAVSSKTPEGGPANNRDQAILQGTNKKLDAEGKGQSRYEILDAELKRIEPVLKRMVDKGQIEGNERFDRLLNRKNEIIVEMNAYAKQANQLVDEYEAKLKAPMRRATNKKGDTVFEPDVGVKSSKKGEDVVRDRYGKIISKPGIEKPETNPIKDSTQAAIKRLEGNIVAFEAEGQKEEAAKAKRTLAALKKKAEENQDTLDREFTEGGKPTSKVEDNLASVKAAEAFIKDFKTKYGKTPDQVLKEAQELNKLTPKKFVKKVSEMKLPNGKNLVESLRKERGGFSTAELFSRVYEHIGLKALMELPFKQGRARLSDQGLADMESVREAYRLGEEQITKLAGDIRKTITDLEQDLLAQTALKEKVQASMKTPQKGKEDVTLSFEQSQKIVQQLKNVFKDLDISKDAEVTQKERIVNHFKANLEGEPSEIADLSKKLGQFLTAPALKDLKDPQSKMNFIEKFSLLSDKKINQQTDSTSDTVIDMKSLRDEIMSIIKSGTIESVTTREAAEAVGKATQAIESTKKRLKKATGVEQAVLSGTQEGRLDYRDTPIAIKKIGKREGDATTYIDVSSGNPITLGDLALKDSIKVRLSGDTKDKKVFTIKGKQILHEMIRSFDWNDPSNFDETKSNGIPWEEYGRHLLAAAASEREGDTVMTHRGPMETRQFQHDIGVSEANMLLEKFEQLKAHHQAADLGDLADIKAERVRIDSSEGHKEELKEKKRLREIFYSFHKSSAARRKDLTNPLLYLDREKLAARVKELSQIAAEKDFKFPDLYNEKVFLQKVIKEFKNFEQSKNKIKKQMSPEMILEKLGYGKKELEGLKERTKRIPEVMLPRDLMNLNMTSSRLAEKIFSQDAEKIGGTRYSREAVDYLLSIEANLIEDIQYIEMALTQKGVPRKRFDSLGNTFEKGEVFRFGMQYYKAKEDFTVSSNELIFGPSEVANRVDLTEALNAGALVKLTPEQEKELKQKLKLMNKNLNQFRSAMRVGEFFPSDELAKQPGVRNQMGGIEQVAPGETIKEYLHVLADLNSQIAHEGRNKAYDQFLSGVSKGKDHREHTHVHGEKAGPRTKKEVEQTIADIFETDLEAARELYNELLQSQENDKETALYVPYAPEHLDKAFSIRKEYIRALRDGYITLPKELRSLEIEVEQDGKKKKIILDDLKEILGNEKWRKAWEDKVDEYQALFRRAGLPDNFMASADPATSLPGQNPLIHNTLRKQFEQESREKDLAVNKPTEIKITKAFAKKNFPSNRVVNHGQNPITWDPLATRRMPKYHLDADGNSKPADFADDDFKVQVNVKNEVIKILEKQLEEGGPFYKIDSNAPSGKSLKKGVSFEEVNKVKTQLKKLKEEVDFIQEVIDSDLFDREDGKRAKNALVKRLNEMGGISWVVDPIVLDNISQLKDAFFGDKKEILPSRATGTNQVLETTTKVFLGFDGSGSRAQLQVEFDNPGDFLFSDGTSVDPQTYGALQDKFGTSLDPNHEDYNKFNSMQNLSSFVITPRKLIEHLLIAGTKNIDALAGSFSRGGQFYADADGGIPLLKFIPHIFDMMLDAFGDTFAVRAEKVQGQINLLKEQKRYYKNKKDGELTALGKDLESRLSVLQKQDEAGLKPKTQAFLEYITDFKMSKTRNLPITKLTEADKTAIDVEINQEYTSSVLIASEKKSFERDQIIVVGEKVNPDTNKKQKVYARVKTITNEDGEQKRYGSYKDFSESDVESDNTRVITNLESRWPKYSKVKDTEGEKTDPVSLQAYVYELELVYDEKDIKRAFYELELDNFTSHKSSSKQSIEKLQGLVEKMALGQDKDKIYDRQKALRAQVKTLSDIFYLKDSSESKSFAKELLKDMTTSNKLVNAKIKAVTQAVREHGGIFLENPDTIKAAEAGVEDDADVNLAQMAYGDPNTNTAASQENTGGSAEGSADDAFFENDYGGASSHFSRQKGPGLISDLLRNTIPRYKAWSDQVLKRKNTDNPDLKPKKKEDMSLGGTHWLTGHDGIYGKYVEQFGPFQKLAPKILKALGIDEKSTEAEKLDATSAFYRQMGKTGDLMDVANREYGNPIKDALYETKVDYDTLGVYLMALSTPQSNRAIKANRDQLGLPAIKNDLGQDNGSGLSNEEAKKLKEDLEKNDSGIIGMLKHKNNPIELIFKMHKKSLDLQLESEMITKTQYDKMLNAATDSNGKFRRLPLRGLALMEDQYADQEDRLALLGGAGEASGKGFDQSRKHAVQTSALGRVESFADPSTMLEHVFQAHEDAIIRSQRAQAATYISNIKDTLFEGAQKNKEVKKLYDAIFDDSAKGVKTVLKPVEDENGNEILRLEQLEIPNEILNSNRAMFVRKAGKPELIMFANTEAGQSLASSAKNLNYEQLKEWAKHLNVTTKLMSKVATSYNPEFWLRNPTRDLMYAYINLGALDKTLPNKRLRKEVTSPIGFGKTAMSLMSFERSIDKHGRAPGGLESMDIEVLANKALNDPLAAYQLLKRAGGKTSFYKFKSILELKKEFKISGKAPRKGAGIKKVLRIVTDAVDLLNTALENAIRVRTLQASLRAGYTLDKAIDMSRNITVDFNKRGTNSQNLGALIQFANPSIQGTRNFGTSLKRRGAKASASLGLKLVTASFAYNTAMRVLTARDEEEDDGGNSVDDIPSIMRQGHMIIPTRLFSGESDDSGHFKIPFAMGPHVMWGMGDVFSKMVTNAGKGNENEVVVDSMDWFRNALFTTAPIPNANIMGLPLPPVLAPAVEIMRNESWYGAPIYRETPYNKNQSPSKLSTGETSPLANMTSEGLNALFGGDQQTAGSTLSFLGLSDPLEHSENDPFNVRLGGRVSASALSYMFSQYFGGFGRALSSGVNLFLEDPSNLNAKDIPILRGVYSPKTLDYGTIRRYYDLLNRAHEAKGTLDSLGTSAERAQFIRENPHYVDLIKSTEKAESGISMYRRKRKLLDKQKDSESKLQQREKLEKMRINTMRKAIIKAREMGLDV